MRRLAALAVAALLAGCGTGARVPPQATVGGPLGEAGKPGGAAYECDAGLRLVVRTQGDETRIEGLPQGPDLLGRDAGGLDPLQSVWTGDRWRAEFGLGEDGRGALLHPLPAGTDLRCRRR
jgi:hypothetical protein